MYLEIALICAVVIVFIFSQVLLIPSVRTVRKFLKLPGRKSLFLLGPIHRVMFLKNREIVSFVENTIVKGSGRLCPHWFLGSPMVGIFHPDDLKVILGSVHCTDKGWEYDFFKPWLQEGLLTSQGKKWTERRKLLTTAFHFKILEDSLESICKHGKCLADNLLKNQSEVICANDAIYKCVLDIICETAMNVSLDPSDKASVEYVAATRRVAAGMLFRFLNLYLRKEWLWKLTPAGRRFVKDVRIVHNFTENIISKRREELKKKFRSKNIAGPESSVSKRQPFLDKLIQLDMDNLGALTDSDIREEVDTFMYVGHDSTAGTLEFLIWELGRNQRIQDSVYEEIYSVVGDDERDITREDISQMTYLDRVIKEGLRLYPAAPYMSRKITKDLKLDDGTELAAGFNAVISPYFIHRDPAFYENPSEFQPDRFDPAAHMKRHPFSYIPFSAGPRNCLGQKFAMLQMKILLATVLRSCRFVSVTTELVLIPLVILTTDEPIYIKVLPRRSDI